MRTWTLGSGHRGALEQIADELSWCIWELPGANSSVHPSGPQEQKTRVEIDGRRNRLRKEGVWPQAVSSPPCRGGVGGGLTTGKSRVSKGQNRGANGIRKLNKNTRAPLPQPACPSRQKQSPVGGPDNEPVLQAGWQGADSRKSWFLSSSSLHPREGCPGFKHPFHKRKCRWPKGTWTDHC